jgi:HK97 family phage major capsid protein
MNLSDKVLDAAEKHGVLKSQLTKLDKQLGEVLKSLEADDADEAVLMPQVEELTGQLEDLRPEVVASEKKLNALKQAENALAARARPIEGAPGIIKSHPRLKPDYKPGDLFVKQALIKAIAHTTRQRDEEILEERYGDNDALKAVFGWQRKAAVPVADTTTTGWAAELVQTDMQGFLDLLTATSVGAALASRSMMLNFGGFSSITVPRMNQIGTPQTEPAWVGEGGVIPLQRFSFGSTTLSRTKLASIVPMTNELIQQSTPSAEQIIRRGMEEAYSIMLDNAILSASAAVAGVRPAGLLAGVVVAAGSGAGAGYENVVADIQAMLAELAASRLGRRPVLIVNDEDYTGIGMLLNPLGQMPFRDDINGGRLLGLEIVHSANVTKGTAIMVDVSVLTTAFDGPEFMVSEQATLTMADAGAAAPTQAGTDGTPGAIGTAGQVPPDSGIPVVGGVGASIAGYSAASMFQTYSTAIRGIWPTAWSLLRPGAVAARNALQWT